jgi:predicted DNA-binding transcriptional regulator AlpA
MRGVRSFENFNKPSKIGPEVFAKEVLEILDQVQHLLERWISNCEAYKTESKRRDELPQMCKEPANADGNTKHVQLDSIPDVGFVRLNQILKVIPIGKTCWWEGIKTGRFPKPVKLSARCTAWRAEDIRNLIVDLGR